VSVRVGGDSEHRRLEHGRYNRSRWRQLRARAADLCTSTVLSPGNVQDREKEEGCSERDRNDVE
jgi:hypothetical protein